MMFLPRTVVSRSIPASHAHAYISKDSPGSIPTPELKNDFQIRSPLVTPQPATTAFHNLFCIPSDHCRIIETLPKIRRNPNGAGGLVGTPSQMFRIECDSNLICFQSSCQVAYPSSHLLSLAVLWQPEMLGFLMAVVRSFNGR